ncbi:unnamed protein product [Brassica napus]|uniref:(rape) hypothetical protein n=1 Tax=Brassica napus TaxID=3708 RepID=A0A816TLZ3_BRANA|nr:unnamed protein product [Brassica napus]
MSLVRSTLAAKINFVAKISHASDRNSEDVFKTISSQNNPQDPPNRTLLHLLSIK